MMKRILIIGGGLLFLLGLISPVAWHYFYWYTPFTIGGFLLFEGLNWPGFSVLQHPRRFCAVWLSFIVLAAVTELIGYTWLKAWNYPGFTAGQYFAEVVVIGYPFVGFFALELFVFLQRIVRPKALQYLVLPIAVLLFSYLNEIPNTFVYEWQYTSAPLGSLFDVPVHITILWFLIVLFVPFQYFFSPSKMISSLAVRCGIE